MSTKSTCSLTKIITIIGFKNVIKNPNTAIYLYALKKSFSYYRLPFRNSSDNSARTTNGASFTCCVTYWLWNKAILFVDEMPRWIWPRWPSPASPLCIRQNTVYISSFVQTEISTFWCFLLICLYKNFLPLIFLIINCRAHLRKLRLANSSSKLLSIKLISLLSLRFSQVWITC